MRAWRTAGPALVLLAGCAAVDPQPPAPASAPLQPEPPAAAVAPPSAQQDPDLPGAVRLRCEDGTELRVAFADDEARVSGLAAGDQVLLRDAGGVTPQQSVYTNEAVRAEFGLGQDAREANLHLLHPQVRLHCVRR